MQMPWQFAVAEPMFGPLQLLLSQSVPYTGVNSKRSGKSAGSKSMFQSQTNPLSEAQRSQICNCQIPFNCEPIKPFKLFRLS